MDRATIRSTSQALGIGTALFMSGIYFGTSHIAITPLLPLPINESTRIWAAIYHSGAPVMITLALASTALSGTAAYLTPTKRTSFSVAAVTAIGTLAYTVLFMMGGIQTLLEISQMDGSQIQGVRRDEVLTLLTTWQNQNYVRAALGVVSGLTGLYATFLS